MNRGASTEGGGVAALTAASAAVLEFPEIKATPRSSPMPIKDQNRILISTPGQVSL
jgi:hypothetical protein